MFRCRPAAATFANVEQQSRNDEGTPNTQDPKSPDVCRRVPADTRCLESPCRLQGMARVIQPRRVRPPWDTGCLPVDRPAEWRHHRSIVSRKPWTSHMWE